MSKEYIQMINMVGSIGYQLSTTRQESGVLLCNNMWLLKGKGVNGVNGGVVVLVRGLVISHMMCILAYQTTIRRLFMKYREAIYNI